MATVTLTAEDFESTVLADGIVLVDWWAAWCGPCRMFAPIFEEASEARPHITFAKVDTEAEQGLAAAAGISSIPTLMIFRDGILLFSEAGALPGPALAGLLDQVEALDMAEVRADIERMKAEAEPA
jgi:thioredoxin 1